LKTTRSVVSESSILISSWKKVKLVETMDEKLTKTLGSPDKVMEGFGRSKFDPGKRETESEERERLGSKEPEESEYLSLSSKSSRGVKAASMAGEISQEKVDFVVAEMIRHGRSTTGIRIAQCQ
jgi:hypothetical protein